MKFQGKTSLIFLFYCDTVSRESGEKMLRFFWFFGIKKLNCLMVSYIKLTWNYETAKFGQETKIETDGTRLRRGRQFQFFFLTEFGRFHNFSQFHVWNHSQFHFLSQKTEKIPTFFASFTWNWPQKKKKGGLYLKHFGQNVLNCTLYFKHFGRAPKEFSQKA